MLGKSTIFFSLLLAVTAMAGQCVAPPAPESAPPARQGDEPKIVVMEPWSRPSPVMTGNGAVYMTLMNEGRGADALVGAETDVAEVVELHKSKMEGDVMEMSRVPDIQVPAGGSARLVPGGGT